MARGDRAHPRRRRLLVPGLVLLLVVALVAAGGVAWRTGLLDGWLDRDRVVPEPAAIAPPAGVEEPELTPPDPVAEPATGAPGGAAGADAAAVRRAVAATLRDPRLGPHVLATVASLEGDDPPLLDLAEGDQRATPASTTKLVTSTAALLALGPDQTFETSVVRQGRQVVLVGGGDPFLERGPQEADGSAHPYPDRADLADLAARTADALDVGGARARAPRVRLGFDDSLFSGPAVNPTWESDYVSAGEVSPTSALWVDEGRDADGVGVADPAAEAASAFADALAREGVRVLGAPRRTTVTDPDAAAAGQRLASVSSAPVGEIVERLLEVSDNDAAEVLLRQVGLATAGEGSIEAGRAGVRDLLGQAGVRLRGSVLYDGSGLSRDGLLDPEVLVDVLRLASSPVRPDLRAAVTGLPVAGFSGSLADRLAQGPQAAFGRVRAKTGTLSGVSSLAGVALDLDGTPLVFVLMADRIGEVDTLDAIAALDRAAASLGACACG